MYWKGFAAALLYLGARTLYRDARRNGVKAHWLVVILLADFAVLATE